MYIAQHPSEYVLVKNLQGKFFRLSPGCNIPRGYEKVLQDGYGRSVYDSNGRLAPKYWALKRISGSVEMKIVRGS